MNAPIDLSAAYRAVLNRPGTAITVGNICISKAGENAELWPADRPSDVICVTRGEIRAVIDILSAIQEG